MAAVIAWLRVVLIVVTIAVVVFIGVLAWLDYQHHDRVPGGPAQQASAAVLALAAPARARGPPGRGRPVSLSPGARPVRQIGHSVAGFETTAG
jgi:hypothetical protein